jgi:hypothetical protein
MLSYADDDARSFSAPSDIVLVGVDPESGLLATPDCPVVRYEPFVAGTEPLEFCPLHGGYGRPEPKDGWWIF